MDEVINYAWSLMIYEGMNNEDACEVAGVEYGVNPELIQLVW